MNYSSDLKIFENSRLSALNFKSFSRSLEHFFLTVGQNNFGNKIPDICFTKIAHHRTLLERLWPTHRTAHLLLLTRAAAQVPRESKVLT